MKWLKPASATPIALIYTETFHLLFSQINRIPLENKDMLGISIGTPETLIGSLPDGLEWRAKNAISNLLEFPVLEARKVGYEVEIITDDSGNGKEIDRTEFAKAIKKLDAGKANALITYSEMLPRSLQNDGAPSQELLERADKNNWRLILINVLANPEISSSYWQTEYVHIVKNDKSVCVIVTVKDSIIDESILRSLNSL